MKEIFAIIVVLCIGIGCTKNDSSTNPATSSDFIPLPLKAGNTWIYNSTNPNRSGQDTFSISGTAALNGESGYLLDNGGCYYKEGILYKCEVNSPSTTAEVVFPKNPVVGQTWIVNGNTWKLVATNVPITVPAGTFSCYRITIAGTSPSTVYWASGKGFIKMGESSDAVHYELKSIQLN